MDTNTLYLVIGAFIAVIILFGLFKSNVFKVKITKEGMNIEASQQQKEKGFTNIKKVKGGSKIEVARADGHDIEIEKIDGSTIKITK